MARKGSVKVKKDHDDKIGESYYVKRKENGLHMFCGKCKSYSKPIEITYKFLTDAIEAAGVKVNNFEDFNAANTVDAKPMEMYTNDDNIAMLQCSVCNHAANYNTMTYLRYDDKNPNTSFFNAAVFDNGDKVTLNYATRTITMWNNKLQYKLTDYLIVFNTVTGQAYELEPRVNKKRDPSYTGAKIRGFTYGSNTGISPFITSVPLETRKELYQLIYDKIQARVHFPIPTFEDHLKNEFVERPKKRRNVIPTPVLKSDIYSIKNIALFNRMPMMNPQIYSSFVGDKFRTNKRTQVGDKTITTTSLNRKIASIKNTCLNPMMEFFKIFNVPSKKSLKKLALEDMMVLFSYKYFSSLFSNHNNIMKILEINPRLCHTKGMGMFRKEMKRRKLKDTNSDYGYDPYDRDEFNSEVEQFHIDMIAKFGESTWADKVAQCGDDTIIRDTHRAMKEILLRIPDAKLDLTGPIHDVHNRLSKYLDTLKNPNIVIPYVDEAYMLEDEIDGYKFTLATDTQTLRLAGKEMSICVGTYTTQALRRECSIVLVSLNDKDIVCVELTGDGQLLKQAKLNSNQHPQGKDKEIIFEWMRKKQIVNASYDLGGNNDYEYNRRDHYGKVPEGVDVEELVRQSYGDAPQRTRAEARPRVHPEFQAHEAPNPQRERAPF